MAAARYPTAVIDRDHPLLLGSGSPRRRAILGQLGIPIVTRAVEVDESPCSGESPDDYLARIVDAKLAALAEVELPSAVGGRLVADTAVIIGPRILGKPRDVAGARAMLRALSGQTHRVSTRFALATPAAPRRAAFAETVDSEVRFRALTEEHIRRYAATGEGLDKAGAYAVQGIGAFAVEHVGGSYTNVVGLPACSVVRALEGVGLLAGYPLEPEVAQGGA